MAELRGKRIDNTLFGQEDVVSSSPEQRGRNQEVLEARTEHLLYRYEYYSRDYRNSYPWKVAQLSEQFYLRAYTVSWIISEHLDRIAQIKQEGLSVRQLKKRWEWMEW